MHYRRSRRTEGQLKPDAFYNQSRHSIEGMATWDDRRTIACNVGVSSAEAEATNATIQLDLLTKPCELHSTRPGLLRKSIPFPWSPFYKKGMVYGLAVPLQLLGVLHEHGVSVLLPALLRVDNHHGTGTVREHQALIYDIFKASPLFCTVTILHSRIPGVIPNPEIWSGLSCGGLLSQPTSRTSEWVRTSSNS